MKYAMVISGFLYIWVASLAAMPEPAQAAGMHNGTYYPGGELSENPGWRWIETLFEGEEKEPDPVDATSVKEANASTPDCADGYRWGRARPDDPITKIYC
ncbi:hypothetical protein [Pseudomonas sp. GL93]|uniref:hypothetical protein n=1 Tax=Pseudomonas sp. GL93 TaxID=2014741 RepID=UPI0010589886|nr:hypothetical protein [Pseudomonas sp. GL93]